jgi:hypothetical protein
MASPTVKALKAIPQDVQEDLLSLAILQKDLRETRLATEKCQKAVIEKLIDTKMDATLVEALGRARDRRAAKRTKAVRG